jgi:hypothetical protein
VSIEVHNGSDGHVAFIAVKFEVLVGLYWGVVGEEIRFLFSCKLFKGDGVSISKWSILIKEAVVLPEHIQSTERKLTDLGIVDPINT